MDDVTITTFAERPALIGTVDSMADIWPEFMHHDPVAKALLWQVVAAFPALCIAATDPSGTLVARGRAIPFRWDAPGRDRVLPAAGWDQVLVWGMDDRAGGESTDTVSALEIAILPSWLGGGLSGRMLDAMRSAARAAGYAELLAPVRPTHKHLYPTMPMAEYIGRLRPDSLPDDPWLRVHVRAGGTIERVAPASMVIAGSLTEWRDRTGLPFEEAGPVPVPQALVPVVCDPVHDYAVYVEPNVWVRHRL